MNLSMIEYCCEIRSFLVAIVRRSSACAAPPTMRYLGLVSFIVSKLASYSWRLIGPKDQG